MTSQAAAEALQASSSVSRTTEALAGLSTFLTMSYIFLLNPSLLAKAGIPPSAAFVATVVAAIFSTVLMGLYAKLPYAVAPVPTVTAFFVFYVCGKMGIHWQSALFAVLISGLLSILATYFSIRERLIKSMPEGLKTALMFAIGGFLVANGLKLANILPYDAGGIAFGKVSLSAWTTREATIAWCGLAIALVLNSRILKFKAGPLVALIFCIILAHKLGLPLGKPKFDLHEAFASFGQISLGDAVDPRVAFKFWLATFVFFLVDFYGAIGKFVGLWELSKSSVDCDEDGVIGRALAVDGVGTTLGALLGTSSVAVFISSAVGVLSGGRSGATALFCAAFMLLSAVLMPMVGSIPTVVNAGILIYIGSILMPWRLTVPSKNRSHFDMVVAGTAAFVSLLTCGVDDGLLVAFVAYTLIPRRTVDRSNRGATLYLRVTTGLLAVSVAAQWIFA